MGSGGGFYAGRRGEVVAGFCKLQCNIGWMCLRVFIVQVELTGLMILLMGKGPLYFGPSFFEGCLDCRYLVDR